MPADPLLPPSSPAPPGGHSAQPAGNHPAAEPLPPPGGPWLVACLCAAWCGTCTAYRSTLATLAAQHPDMCFAWVDIEDDADALGDDALDIEDFPTVMVLHRGEVRFHGTLLPHAATLAQLLQRLRADGAASGHAGQVPPGMAAAVLRLGPQRPL